MREIMKTRNRGKQIGGLEYKERQREGYTMLTYRDTAFPSLGMEALCEAKKYVHRRD